MTTQHANKSGDVAEHDEDLSQQTAADRPKTRSCLRCETRFMSAWSGERICPRCKGSSAWRNDAPLPQRTGTNAG